MEKLGKYLQGYVKIRLESSMPERFLSLCVHNQIPLWNLKNKDLYYEMEISVRNYFRLNAFRRKTQSKILLLEKHGLPFFFKKIKRERLFFLVFFLEFFCYMFALCLSGTYKFMEIISTPRRRCWRRWKLFRSETEP